MDVREALRALEDATRRGVEDVRAAASLEEVESAEKRVLGRKGPVADVQRTLGSLPEEDRRTLGRAVNEAFDTIRAAAAERTASLRGEAERGIVERDRVDVTLPGRRPPQGGLHPLTHTERRVLDALFGLGYRLMAAPEIDSDWYVFESLNIPPDHPARTMQDTLYPVTPGRPDLVLRTHTSNVQVRAMEAQEPPIYVVTLGRCFRRDVPDSTHSPVFDQVEILAVDEDLSLSDMRGTLEAFARAVFGPEQRIRLRPGYFPFVEPGAEVDVSCFVCGGTGCRVCEEGWIEILGAGMVHPKVLEAGGVDPERYTGFAAGLGMERVAMLRHAVPDIRLFYEGDVRMLRQFARSA
ncbi:MAG: phenylalanine--tRNA ligase subunit alpha [Actinomycetota bacterium]|nr:phenylalanine--tRNA ligase subunit alpha [Actinomycetota bacterium]